MKTQLLFLAAMITIAFSLNAQTGPGGVGDTSGTSILQLWLMADKGIAPATDGTPIVVWEDKSGANNDVLATLSIAPLYKNNAAAGLPGLQFDGVQQYMQSDTADSSFSNTQATLFIVAKSNDYYGTAPMAIAQYNFYNEFLFFNGTAQHHISSGWFTSLNHNCQDSIPDTSVAILCGKWGASQFDLNYYINGLPSVSSIDSFGPSPVPDYAILKRIITVGQRASLISGHYFDGIILEIIGYNVKLNDTQRQAVEEYLRCKYNIQNNSCGNLNTSPCFTYLDENRNEKKIQVAISPNPFIHTTTIEIQNSKFKIQNLELKIYDVLGQQVHRQILNSKLEIINLELPSGIYFYKVTSSFSFGEGRGEAIANGKLMIQ